MSESEFSQVVRCILDLLALELLAEYRAALNQTSLQDGVATGGKNFSSGQRQLLALARGLLKLKSSSILILDESTANLGEQSAGCDVWSISTADDLPSVLFLDHASDAAIQEVLREKLGDVTMLVVAHRLRTVIECDKILVLDAGRVSYARLCPCFCLPLCGFADHIRPSATDNRPGCRVWRPR